MSIVNQNEGSFKGDSTKFQGRGFIRKAEMASSKFKLVNEQSKNQVF